MAILKHVSIAILERKLKVKRCMDRHANIILISISNYRLRPQSSLRLVEQLAKQLYWDNEELDED